ncbi:MAG: HNH endonuclease [Mitsuaria chitosanitabida]|uniref:HNH endonuclease signature motif containing protein n=1 Tax=Roseateles chitosanitabidus TaxID=65048 RepID=UPI001B11CDD2|nr:HNH endonuclease signature motif containing protein [Roseateles chitosanitabidus]MBO9687089.1 HNH endonuclease [Roseateles chitosanitabidus]
MNRLQVDSYEEHLDIAFPAAAPAGLTEPEKAVLLQLYVRYEQAAGRPQPNLLGTELTEASLLKVLNAYDLIQERRRLSKLRTSLKLLAERCPYCGYGTIDELDHFLQKDIYKAFSVFPLNLVPCCGPCNRMKPKQPSALAEQHQVHVYLEDVSQYDMLRADVAIAPATGGLLIGFRLQQPAHMPAELFNRVVHHMTTFKLRERFVRQTNIFLAGLETAMDDAFEAGPLVLQQYLGRTAASIARRAGNNDWRSALMAGLSACPAFFGGAYKQALGSRPEAG